MDSCLRDHDSNQIHDVSDILAKDLGKRLIEKDNEEDSRRIKKSRKKTSTLSPIQSPSKSVNFSNELVDLKYLNKTPDEIIENTLKELSTLNELLNQALDKTLGLNDIEMPIADSSFKKRVDEKNQRVLNKPSLNDHTEFKVPNVPSFKKQSSKINEKSFSSSSKDIGSTELKEKFSETDLIASIAKEIIINESNDISKGNETELLKNKKKKKKKDEKHTHHCSKHRRTLAELEKKRNDSVKELLKESNEENFKIQNKSIKETKRNDTYYKSEDEYFSNKSYKEDKNYKEDKYCSAPTSSKKLDRHKKGYQEPVSSSNRCYSDDEYDQDNRLSRKYESSKYYDNKHKSYKYYDYDKPYEEYERINYEKSYDYDRPYEKGYDHDKSYKYDKPYDKHHEKQHDKFDRNYKFDYKNPIYLKRLRTENSISDWTKFCTKLSKDKDDDNSSIESRDFYSDDDDKRSIISERVLNRDTLKLKEIKFEVRDFKSRQVRSATEIKQELMEQFPVSSGFKHQWTEIEKQPVGKESSTSKVKNKKYSGVKSSDQKDQELEDKVDDFLTKHVQNDKFTFDIGTIMAQRLSALKVLAKDENNITALNQLKEADDLINEWSLAKSSNEEDKNNENDKQNLLTDSAKNHNFVSYPNFTKAAENKEGIGIALLCKMGWTPGQGLGKNNEGVIEPLIPELKLDTKGLITKEEKDANKKNNVQNMYKIPKINNATNNKIVNNNNQKSGEQLTKIANQSIINGKHPVNVLQEVCLKRNWTQPTYTIVSEDGPAHKKNFLIKCNLNKVDYLPSFSSPNKKLAKAIAAIVCLQAFGLINFDET